MWRWRRAGPENMMPRILILIFAILMTGAGVAVYWVLTAHGSSQATQTLDSDAYELWGQHSPAYTVSINEGNAVVSETGVIGMTLSLTGNPTQLLVGQTATLTGSASESTNGYTLGIYDESTGQWVTGGSEQTISASVNQQTPGTHTYVLYLGTPGGAPIQSSSPVQITWEAYQVSIQASPSPADIGQTITVSGQVTAGGSGVPNIPVSLQASGGNLAAANVTTNAQGQWSTTFSATTPGTYTLTATVYGQSTTTTVQVQGATAVTLTATPVSTAPGNTTVTLTAQANAPLAPNQTLSIVDVTTGQTIAGPSNQQTLTTTYTLSQGATNQFVAYLNTN
ncbi:Ig domain protein group 1 domain protein [Alicyclobacillus acidocaldarius subsp. acidocaldarius Tc-4-1]|uniref:Ig domain protein group 1 domain protein n=2 Tax=Alicyclobacillus acidocaldarius TaxID=405212 RepID=F8IGL7_ALIAT|nr:Ig domain protein group 1 domain protein [Alicyclobacillus acidocaldarius subsp. acidocaldarius Tc-4-1]